MRISEKQLAFIESTADKVLYGGAAGGGKSYVQVIDGLLKALKYPGIRQLFLRRTYVELDRSLIRTALGIYPTDIYKYSSVSHTMVFNNGSVIDFGYCAAERDVFKYQSAEYDIIRFDEATHFSESQYNYLCSRVRGANSFPKQVKLTTNPGNIGHGFIKNSFVDPSEAGKEFEALIGVNPGGGKIYEKRLFIPALLDDNPFMKESDPEYGDRLALLDPVQYKALRFGDWNIFEGQYFSEFSREYHVIEPFTPDPSWRRYRAIDYGLDALACVWAAVDGEGNIYIYRELQKSDSPIYESARLICELTPPGEKIYLTLAPPDIWGRSQESGMRKADIFRESGVELTKSSNDREAGWLAIKELLRLRENGKPKLFICSNCVKLIKCLPSLIRDIRNPTDCRTEPHDITHLPDALRYLAVWWREPADAAENGFEGWSQDLIDDYECGNEEERRAIENRMRKGKILNGNFSGALPPDPRDFSRKIE